MEISRKGQVCPGHRAGWSFRSRIRKRRHQGGASEGLRAQQDGPGLKLGSRMQRGQCDIGGVERKGRVRRVVVSGRVSGPAGRDPGQGRWPPVGARLLGLRRAGAGRSRKPGPHGPPPPWLVPPRPSRSRPLPQRSRPPAPLHDRLRPPGSTGGGGECGRREPGAPRAGSGVPAARAPARGSGATVAGRPGALSRS